MTGLGVLCLSTVLTVLAPLGVLGFLARSLAIVAPLTAAIITSGLLLALVSLARVVRLRLGPRTLG